MAISAALTLGACAIGACALKPVPKPLPRPADARVKRDGLLLRAYGASLKDERAAEADARRLLREYAATLDVAGELPERSARLDRAAAAARAQSLPAKAGFAYIAELELGRLQELLGTRYDLSP